MKNLQHALIWFSNIDNILAKDLVKKYYPERDITTITDGEIECIWAYQLSSADINNEDISDYYTH